MSSVLYRAHFVGISKEKGADFVRPFTKRNRYFLVLMGVRISAFIPSESRDA